MKTMKQKDTKEKYEKIVKLVKKAEKEAVKFIQQNQKLDPQLRLKYF